MTALVRQFADEPDTCLFGTMSLWQGVDVPGVSCRLVVIDRIPFPRPDDPLMTARSRAVAQAVGNGSSQSRRPTPPSVSPRRGPADPFNV